MAPPVDPAVVGLLLAAGAGRRAGGPKALRVGPDETSWLARSVRVLLDGGCPRVVVVLGAEAATARSLLVGIADIDVVVATDWALGMNASLRAGLAAVPPGRAALVHLVDLPDVGAAVVRRLLAEAGTGPAALARACYRGRPGHPVLIGADHVGPMATWLTEAATLPVVRDVGGREYLSSHRVRCIDCSALASGADVDD